MLDHLTYHSEALSPAVWTTFGPVFVSFNGWAQDYLPNMAISIENFIQKGNAQFLGGSYEGVRNVECVLRMVHKGKYTYLLSYELSYLYLLTNFLPYLLTNLLILTN